jgi:hypothetical protein
VDFSSFNHGAAAPGNDTRQWCSYGIVDDDQEDQKSVTFDPEHGPLVSVTLQPSGMPVTCRVASWCAGNGEASYFPFVSGDECIVLVPEGDERAGCIIVGRGNSEIDRFPTTVAGQDVTKNSVAFHRVRCPYVFETADSWMVRGATTGNFLLLEKAGNVTVADGFKDFVHVGADFVGLQASDADGAPVLLLQLDKNNKLVTLEATGGGKLTQGVDGNGSWYAVGQISFGAGGMVAGEHLATVEGVANLVSSVLIGLAAFSAPGALATLSNPVVSQGVVAAAATLAGTGALLPPTLAAIQTALSAKLQNPTGLKPGIGSPSLLGG